jgi:hypothetical protein
MGMGRWVKLWLLLSAATLGIGPPLGVTSWPVSAAPAWQPVVAAGVDPADQPQGDQGDGVPWRYRRSTWGILALASLLVVLASLISLMVSQRRQGHTGGNASGNFSPVSSPPLSPPVPRGSGSEPSLTTANRPKPALAKQTLDETTRLVPVNIVETLIEELASADGTVRRKAIWDLGQQGSSVAIQPLVNSLVDADSKERSLILAALAEISSRSFKPLHQAMAMALQDPSPEVRKNAIRDLSRIYDSTVQLSRFLAHATQDNDPEVQATARWALEQLNHIHPSFPPADTPPEAIPPSSQDNLPGAHSP